MNSNFDHHPVHNHFLSNIKQKVVENSIFNREPSHDWVDGHPLGNGYRLTRIF